MAIQEKQVTTSPTLPPIQQTVSVADVILKQLSAWGVKHMYGIPGDAILPFLDAINRQHQIQFFSVRHEFAAAIMASTEGKCTQRIGVCIGTSGPGLVNMLNGIADAAADRIPMLVITGQVETKKIGTDTKQYVDQQQMITPLAVYSESLYHPEAITDVLHKAMIEALDKRGVAHLSIPKDLFSMPCRGQARSPVGVLQNEKKQELRQLDRAVMIISSAKKPMLLIGEGARGARTEITQMAELLQCGIIESLGAKGTIPYTHPHYVSGIGEGGTVEGKNLLMQSDCILVIGANWWPEGFVPQQTQVVQVDISCASIEAHPQVVCGLVGDAAEILRLLIQRVRDIQEVHQVNRDSWQQVISQMKQKIEGKLDQERSLTSSPPIAPQRLMASIEQVVAEDAIMVIDTGDHTIWFNRIFRARQQQVLYSGNWRTMGFALPAAISAKASYPDKQVVAIVGDGCLTMSMMELLTAVKYELPIIAIVVNNQCLAMEKHKMMVEGYRPYAVELHNPNFAQLAMSCGAAGFEVEQEQDLIPTLKQAFALNQPVLIDVHTSDLMPPLAGM